MTALLPNERTHIEWWPSGTGGFVGVVSCDGKDMGRCGETGRDKGGATFSVRLRWLGETLNRDGLPMGDMFALIEELRAHAEAKRSAA